MSTEQKEKLWNAMKDRSPTAVRMLLTEFPELARVDLGFSNTPIKAAAYLCGNDLDVALALFDGGAHPDDRTGLSEAHWTALHYAVKHSLTALAELLLERGADPTLKWNGLDAAALASTPEMRERVPLPDSARPPQPVPAPAEIAAEAGPIGVPEGMLTTAVGGDISTWTAVAAESLPAAAAAAAAPLEPSTAATSAAAAAAATETAVGDASSTDPLASPAVPAAVAMATGCSQDPPPTQPVDTEPAAMVVTDGASDGLRAGSGDGVAADGGPPESASNFSGGVDPVDAGRGTGANIAAAAADASGDTALGSQVLEMETEWLAAEPAAAAATVAAEDGVATAMDIETEENDPANEYISVGDEPSQDDGASNMDAMAVA
mmetsp:Transcript_11651/g.29925  ORF Transcript_11651/g.29925 Transcript_11651/m.29925 type:complete len:378 (-) Transcript_11651:104-1237(-)